MKLTIKIKMILVFGIIALAIIGLGGYSNLTIKAVNDQSSIMEKEWIR